jgi:xylulokinase
MTQKLDRRYVLAVDLGTSGAKVALVATDDGSVAGHATEPTTLRLLPGGGAEQDPDDWWRAIVAASRRLLGGAGAPPEAAAAAGSVAPPGAAVPPEAVVAVCMSAQWGGTVAVDGAGRPVHPAVIWMDGRGAEHSRRLTGGGVLVPGTAYNARRLATWLRRTGGVPSPTGKDPVGQVQWLRHAAPDAHAAARWFLDVPEYLTMRLCGRAVAGYDTAVLRWCSDNRDPHRVRWDEELAARCGLDVATLPELVPPASVVGPILPAVARELGLGDHVQVVVGTGDTTAAAVGAGTVGDHEAHLYVGTSAWLTCHVPYKKTDLRTNIASLPAVVPGRYWVATVQDVAGKALTWLADNVVYPDPATAPPDALERLNALAATAPAGSGGLVFTPWLNGERTPVEDSRLRGGWFGLTLGTDQPALVRSVFEGVALNARWMLEAVEGFVKLPRDRRRFESLTFVGGGARSALWCQVMADVLDRPVRQAADPVLANARGAGLIAAVALGDLGWDDVPGCVAVEATYEPDPTTWSTYDRAYRTFRDVHRRTRGLHRRHRPADGATTEAEASPALAGGAGGAVGGTEAGATPPALAGGAGGAGAAATDTGTSGPAAGPAPSPAGVDTTGAPAAAG